jgi:hypothetical protein
MLWGLGIMKKGILIMVVAIIIATGVAWHGRGRWY